MLAIGGVGVCALIWGTTWYAITFQLGAVDPVVSVVMRFAIAAAVLALVVKATGGRHDRRPPASHPGPPASLGGER